jgi:acyl-CoA synthetase (NDP forming)
MIRNPIDAHLILTEPELLGKTLEMLSAQPELNMFIISLHMDWLFSRGQGEISQRITDYIATEAAKHTSGKPLVVSLRQYNPNTNIRKNMEEVKKRLRSAGVPFYEGIPRAAAALANIVKYCESQENMK